MNITQETNDYYYSDEEVDKLKDIIRFGLSKRFDYSFNREYEIDHQSGWASSTSAKYPTTDEILEDKLRTTPSAGLTWISKSFRINWNKLWKRIKLK